MHHELLPFSVPSSGLQPLIEKAQTFISNACSEATQRQYTASWNDFERWSAPNVVFTGCLNMAERKKLDRKVINLIAAAERHDGFADVPPGSINEESEGELAVYGYAVARSDKLWLGGYRIYSPESVQAGNYIPHVPRSIFTCALSKFAHVADAPDFNVEAVLEMRGDIPSN